VSRGQATEPRYRLVRPLGHGGMASVYLAEDRELERPVAIKRLAENFAADPEFRRRFEREACLAAPLSHPNIVAVYDVGEEDGRPFIVMEYVEGESVAEALRRGGRFPVAESLRIALDACAGLGAAHAAGLVHRDIKPHNLLITPEGTVKIADFGLARSLEGTFLTDHGTVMGTAAYLAPEQLDGGEVSAAADVYSLGAVLYELLTGEAPRSASTLVELVQRGHDEPVRPVHELAADVPSAVEAAVMHALATDPAARPPSADAFATELRSAEDATTVVSRPADAPTEPLLRRPRRQRRAAVFLAAALAMLAAVVAAVAIGVSTSDGSSKSAPVVPPRSSGTPAQQASAFAAWLRAHAQ
jgi:eukaryotic-like serine/threonine-protein kinase